MYQRLGLESLLRQRQKKIATKNNNEKINKYFTKFLEIFT